MIFLEKEPPLEEGLLPTLPTIVQHRLAVSILFHGGKQATVLCHVWGDVRYLALLTEKLWTDKADLGVVLVVYFSFLLPPFPMLFSSLYFYGDFGLLALRLVLAAIFLVHGLPKLKNPAGIAQAIGASSGMGLAVGLAETLGGVSVGLGVFTQLGAAALAVVMLGALYFKINRWQMPFTAMDKMGWEFDLLLLASALLLVVSGAGSLSLDPALGL